MQENLYCAIGRLVENPEIKTLESKNKAGEKNRVCNFTLAVDETPGKESETVFVDCAAWNHSADFLGAYIKKGAEIYIRGRLRQEKWTAEDGGNRSRLVCVVEKLQG